jgi:hypothetical protein
MLRDNRLHEQMIASMTHNVMSSDAFLPHKHNAYTAIGRNVGYAGLKTVLTLENSSDWSKQRIAKQQRESH